MFCYTAYGLGIHSFLPLPELVAGNGKADVIFQPGKVNGANLQALDELRSFKATSTEACYSMEGVGRFLVRAGKEVVVDPSPGADERTIRLCLLGPVAGLLLHQRGWLTLHASAVAVGGNAVAFIGGQGWGKSTLAAAFHVRGHGMLADDVTAIQTDSDHPVVLPAFPQLKLWPNSIVALGDAPESLPVVHPDLTKRAFRVTSGFAHAPLPLKRIYVLALGERVEIESLSPQEGLVELIGHSYAARFGKELLQATGMATHFKQCARVVQNTSVFRFRRPASLSVLDEHVSLLTKDL
ncbi:MAG: serine kinase [Candidatus Binatia bacterium]